MLREIGNISIITKIWELFCKIKKNQICLGILFQMPKVELKSNAKPSTFAYPPNLEEKKEKAKDKVETAVLSITAKQKKKEAEKKKDEEKMEVVRG